MPESRLSARARRAWGTLAGALAGIVVGSTAISLLLWVGDGMKPLPVTYGQSPVGVFGIVIAPLTFAAVGWILAARLPRNPIGWIFLAAALSIGSMLPVNLLVAATLESLRPAEPLVIVAAWLRSVFAVPAMLSLLVVAALIFPDGRSLPGRWRWGIVAAVVGGGLLVMATALDPRGLPPFPSIPNPTALPPAYEPVVVALRVAGLALAVPAIGAALGAVWHRYAHGDGTVRAQLRWITLGVGISAVLVIPYLVVRYLVPVSNELGEGLAAAAQLGSCAFPISAAFAISRYRLFEVDMLIGRTLVYVPLSALLGGMYTAGIVLFQRLFLAVTGETSDIAIVLAVLVVAATFTPLRRWLESVVDRRFPATAALAETAAPVPGDRTRRRAPRSAGVAPLAGSVPGPHAIDALGAPFVHLVAVDASGGVTCPAGLGRGVRGCLTCPHLVGIARHPQLTIACRPPVS